MPALVSIPVAVVMERREVVQGPWRVTDWMAVAILPGEHLARQGARKVPMRTGGGDDQYLWSGIMLNLYRDSAESYWYNLTGENASLYVVCHESPDGELEPALVTANHDEAVAGQEVDCRVFSTPIPPGIYQAIERFVLDYYVPEAPRKRKRKNWSDEREQ
jgi:hypothetical protein